MIYAPQPFVLHLTSAEPARTHLQTVSGYVPTPEFESVLRASEHAVYPIVPLRTGLSAATCFREQLLQAKESHGAVGKCLHAYSALEYAMMRLFLDPTGLAGFALNGSEIVSVFSHRLRYPKRTLRNLVALGVQLGGIRLNAFDTVLPTLYGQCGFLPVARLAWNDVHAPAGWDYQSVAHYNGGRPDVVFMAHGVSGFSERRVASYEEGLRTQFLALDHRGTRWCEHA